MGWGPGVGFGWREHSILIGGNPWIAGGWIVGATIARFRSQSIVQNHMAMFRSAAKVLLGVTNTAAANATTSITNRSFDSF